MYTYEEMLNKIENSRRFGKQPGAEVSKVMLERMGNPQKDFPFIHVAGTNGKGSVCAFLNSVFQKAGLKVGCFTSPHLTDFRERITVNGKMIGKSAMERIGNDLLSISFGVEPTMFDYCLAAAVLYFREQKCDIAIMETGLGGRLDSTNALGKPVLSVITRIGYDHMAILGNTLTEIAEEKAGILKPGVKAVFAPQEPEVLQVLQSVQHKLNPPSKENERSSYQGITVTSGDIQRVKEMQPGLRGLYQYENAATAMLAAEEYFKMNVSVLSHSRTESVMPEQSGYMQVISDGIHEAYWPGRMEILNERPFFLVDGAHNSNGVLALKESLKELYGDEKFHFIMGVMADKDYKQMVEILAPLAIDFVTVTPDGERALQAKRLAEEIRARGIPAGSLNRVCDIRQCLENAKNEKTVAFGSLYFIGELEKLWRDSLLL